MIVSCQQLSLTGNITYFTMVYNTDETYLFFKWERCQTFTETISLSHRTVFYSLHTVQLHDEVLEQNGTETEV